MSFIVSPNEYFQTVVNEACEKRGFKTFALAKGYLADLLKFYVPAQNLFDEVDASGKRTRETLAETFLKAQSAEPVVRIELMKKMADRSLYIAGFFGDSLQRKLVDVDYYIDMGGMAYGALASSVKEDMTSKLYADYAHRFYDYVEVLSHISSKSALQNEENLMRLFEIYAKTGSEVAREKLFERGLIAVPANLKKTQ